MGSASLSSLPLELLCLIFESADDFSVVAALSQTARVFYNTWRKHPTSICQAVVPRIFSNDAELLVDMQEKSETSRQDGCDDRAIVRAKRLVLNARCASAACDSWVTIITPHDWPFDAEFITPSERARFEHAFYCLWTVGVMASSTHLQEQVSAFLDRGGPREVFRLKQMSTWVKYRDHSNYGSLGLDIRDGTWRLGCDQVSERWQTCNKGHVNIYQGVRMAPHYVFGFYDNIQKHIFRSLPDHW